MTPNCMNPETIWRPSATIRPQFIAILKGAVA